MPGALALHGAKHILVSNCTFAHLGLGGVVVDQHSQNITIVDSTFIDTSGSAIALGNVSHPIQTPAEQDGQYLIARNRIRNTGAEYSGCAGIVAGYVAQTSIMHNDIADTSNGAICLGWGWGVNNTMHSNRVSYNRIEHSNTYLYDCGSIYTLSAQPNSEVSYNFIINQVLLFGSLYHDARSAYFHTHNNVVVGGPMWLCKHCPSQTSATPAHDSRPGLIARRGWQTCNGGRSAQSATRSWSSIFTTRRCADVHVSCSFSSARSCRPLLICLGAVVALVRADCWWLCRHRTSWPPGHMPYKSDDQEQCARKWQRLASCSQKHRSRRWDSRCNPALDPVTAHVPTIIGSQVNI